VSVYLLNFR